MRDVRKLAETTTDAVMRAEESGAPGPVKMARVVGELIDAIPLSGPFAPLLRGVLKLVFRLVAECVVQGAKAAKRRTGEGKVCP